MQRFAASRLLMPSCRRSEAALVEAISTLGVRVERSDLDVAGKILGGVPIGEVLKTATEPAVAVGAWQALMEAMGRREHNDSIPLLVALAAMTLTLVHEKERVLGAIEARGWNADRTASEAVMRLFGTEFNLGRRLVPDRRHRATGRALLTEAVATSAHISVWMHSPASRLRYHGMRGVAYLILARGEFSPSKLALLEATSAELAESQRLGDRSPQHVEYAVEALVRRNQIDPSPSLLDDAQTLINQTGIVSRRLAYDAGDIWLGRGVLALAESGYGFALECLQSAVTAYTAGLQLARRRFDMEDGDLRAKRGYARLRAHHIESRLSIEASLEELDELIGDLECGEPDVYSGLTPLPEALLWRAARLRASGDLDRAIQDLTRAVQFPAPTATRPEVVEVAGRARCQLAECRLELALREPDTAAVESELRVLLAVAPQFDPSIPLLANAARQIVMDRGQLLAAPLVREVASTLRNLMDRPHCQGRARAFAASYRAGLLLRLGDQIDTPELRETCELYTLAVEGSGGDSAPEVLALAADAKLKLAKLLLRSGTRSDEPQMLLEDAAGLLEASIAAANRASESFDEKVAHSKLGETYLRLGSLSDQPEHTEAATRHLEESHRLGNNTPELLGLLGDCYYRLGRAKRDIEWLRRAANLKQSARSPESESVKHDVSMRENWSLTARIEHAIWEIRGDPDALNSAYRAALRAHVCDTRWPWPVFQLAALRRAGGGDVEAGRPPPDLLSRVDPRLVDALRQGTPESLEEVAAHLAVENEEFRRRVLGGRTQVYVLDDPHGLLSGTIVLKRNTKSNAEREAADAMALGDALRACGNDPSFLVARPLAVVPLDGTSSVYAMAHVQARELGSVVVRAHQEGRSTAALMERVVDFLAWFHSWSWQRGIGVESQAPTELRKVAASISNSWLEAGSNLADVQGLRGHLVGVLPAWAATVRKKDAHPENWLVTSRGEVVLIDLESTKQLPVLYDLCQLLDDYPALSVDRDGIRQRRVLMDKYLQSLAARIPDWGDRQWIAGDAWTALCGFILFRVSFGLARLLRRSRGSGDETTSSALRSSDLRRRHYFHLLEWLARDGPVPSVVACARHLSIMAKRLE